MLKRFALASAVAALLSSPAFAQVKPEDVIKYRQGAFEDEYGDMPLDDATLVHRSRLPRRK